VTIVPIDGTFVPEKKSQVLVKHVAELELRAAKASDFEDAEDGDEDDDDDDDADDDE
jgi:hypothetical protein